MHGGATPSGGVPAAFPSSPIVVDTAGSVQGRLDDRRLVCDWARAVKATSERGELLVLDGAHG